MYDDEWWWVKGGWIGVVYFKHKISTKSLNFVLHYKLQSGSIGCKSKTVSLPRCRPHARRLLPLPSSHAAAGTLRVVMSVRGRGLMPAGTTVLVPLVGGGGGGGGGGSGRRSVRVATVRRKQVVQVRL